MLLKLDLLSPIMLELLLLVVRLFLLCPKLLLLEFGPQLLLLTLFLLSFMLLLPQWTTFSSSPLVFRKARTCKHGYLNKQNI